MCRAVTIATNVRGSGKGPNRWITLSSANVYLDHPQYSRHEETLNIDLFGSDGDPADRIAIELDAQSAGKLIDAIRAALLQGADE